MQSNSEKLRNPFLQKLEIKKTTQQRLINRQIREIGNLLEVLEGMQNGWIKLSGRSRLFAS